MDRRAPAQRRRIDAPYHHVDQDDDIADVERQMRQHARVELRDDRQHADERDGDAGELPAGQPVAEHHGARRADGHRRERVHHRDVERGGELQADELQRAEQRAAEQREIGEHAEMRADPRPVALQMRPRERKEDRGGEQPAQGRDGERRHMAGDRAAHQVIAGPAQARQREQQIRVAEQGAFRASFPRVSRYGTALSARRGSWAGSDRRGCRCRRGTGPRRRRSTRR